MWSELVGDVQDSESRLDALRQRVESTGEENTHRDDDEAAAGPSRPPTLEKEEGPISSSLSNSSSRHINLFEDLEQVHLQSYHYSILADMKSMRLWFYYDLAICGSRRPCVEEGTGRDGGGQRLRARAYEERSESVVLFQGIEGG